MSGTTANVARLAIVLIAVFRIAFWAYGCMVCRDERIIAARGYLCIAIVLVAIELAAISYLGAL